MGRPVTRVEFQRYIEGMGLLENYPGIRGFGFAERVAAAAVPAHEARLRGEGRRGYRVLPASDHAERFPIVFFEPVDRNSAWIFGFDISSEPMRRRSMDEARDADAARMTAPIPLMRNVQTQTWSDKGFLILVPVFVEGLPVAADAAARQAGLRGFVYGSFKVADLFDQIFGGPARPDGLGVSKDFPVILLVETTPTNKTASRLVGTRDAAEALDYLFDIGAYSGRDPLPTPQLILVDPQLPKVEGWRPCTEFVPTRAAARRQWSS